MIIRDNGLLSFTAYDILNGITVENRITKGLEDNQILILTWIDHEYILFSTEKLSHSQIVYAMNQFFEKKEKAT